METTPVLLCGMICGDGGSTATDNRTTFPLPNATTAPVIGLGSTPHYCSAS